MPSDQSPAPSDPARLVSELRGAIARHDLSAALAIRRRQALELLAAISERVEARFPAVDAERSSNWAELGSLTRVVEVLGEAALFLGHFGDERAAQTTLGLRI